MTLAEAQRAFDEGNALFSRGRYREAVDAYRRCVDLGPETANARFSLGVALRRLGEPRQAARAFREAARSGAARERATQAAMEALAELARAQAPGDEPGVADNAEPPAGSLSIVVCSVDPRRREAMRANFTRMLEGRDHELIVIEDARSLAEAYNRALDRCRHDVVVFSHDDVELLSPRPFDRVLEALARCDVVGLVGSRRVAGPAVLWAGHPHLHGAIAYPESAGGFVATAFSFERGLIEDVQALDGMFFAARTDVARRIGFDAATFDGFHFYDLDFTYRAHRAGHRLAVTTAIAAVHASDGDFGTSWQGYAERFRRKFPALDAPAAAHHAYHARLDTREAVVRFYRELDALDRAP